MATLTESEEAYDRHGLKVGVIHSDVADVIIKLETEAKAWTELGAKAEADAAAFKEALEYRHTCPNCGGKGVTWVEVDGEAETEVCDCWIRAEHVLYHEEHPGAAQLLTELEAARAVVAAARKEKSVSKYIWTKPGEGTTAVSDFEIALDRALAAYDEVTKARE